MLTSAPWNGLVDDKCAAKIFSTGNTDASTWYRIWEAVTAVFSVCVRGGKGGVSTGIGKSPFSSSFRRYLVCTKGTKERRKGRLDVLTLASGDSGNIFLTVSSLVAAAGMELPLLPANGSMDTTE